MNRNTYYILVLIGLGISTAINYSMSSLISDSNSGSRSYSGSSTNWGGSGGSSWHK